MAKTIEQLKAQGAEVKNATVVGENTATRVGTLFNDIVEHVEDYEAKQAERNKQGIYDVSAYNGGAVFESLSALLNNANLSTLIPTSFRCGGMSIRFIQGSLPNYDNKYVQYRLMTDDWSTTVTDWQGVDDEPTAGSDNLIKSEGVSKMLLNNYGKGANTNLVKVPIQGLLPNNCYRIYLANPSFDRSGDTISYEHTIFGISVTYNGNTSYILNIEGTSATQLKGYYDFVTPEHIDSIDVCVRATSGIRVEFSIENLYSINDIRKIYKWEQGTNGTTPGTITSSNIRCITILNNITKGNAIYFRIKNGYSIIINEWDNGSSTFYKNSGWLSNSAFYGLTCDNVSIVIKKNDDSNISYDSIDNDIIECFVSNTIKPILQYLNENQDIYVGGFVQGTPYTSGQNIGQISSSNIRCCRIIDLPVGTILKGIVKQGYKWTITCWDGVSSSFYTNPYTSFSEGSITLKTFGEKVYIIVGKNTNGSITPSEAEANATIFYNLAKNDSNVIINDIEDNIHYVERNGINYIGEALPFGRKMLIEEYLTIPNWSNSQGGAIYGDYLVTCMATDEIPDNTTNGHLYNIKTGALVSELIFGYTLDGVDYQKPHGNEVCFGKEFYDANSQFPLLYVSQVRDSGESVGVKGGVMVYDLQYDSVNSKYVPVLVQVILPDTEDTELMDVWGFFTPNYVVDTDNDFLYVLNYPHNSWHELNGNTFVCKFALPKLSDGNVITLTSADLIEHYEIPYCFGLQQILYFAGKLYISGGASVSERILRVWDLTKKCETTRINYASLRSEEPQFIGIYQNRFLYYTAGTSGLISEFIF